MRRAICKLFFGDTRVYEEESKRRCAKIRRGMVGGGNIVEPDC